MFTILSKKLLRWGTPDPAYDWMMYGHAVLDEGGLILIDPPVIPGLLLNTGRLGKIDSVVLTTLDHSRGSAFIVKKTGAKLFVPDQTADDVDPMALRLLGEVKDYETYSEGEVAGLSSFRLKTGGNRNIGVPSMNEFALLTRENELMVGDFVSVSPEGKIMVAPEWYPSDEPAIPFTEGRQIFKEVVKRSGARSLVSSHGDCLLGNLQDAIKTI